MAIAGSAVGLLGVSAQAGWHPGPLPAGRLTGLYGTEQCQPFVSAETWDEDTWDDGKTHTDKYYTSPLIEIVPLDDCCWSIKIYAPDGGPAPDPIPPNQPGILVWENTHWCDPHQCWKYMPQALASYYSSIGPFFVVCPHTVLHIEGAVGDTDFWTGNGPACPATTTVGVTCTLSGPETDAWSDSTTNTAPPVGLGNSLSASASISGDHELCKPGAYTLTFTFAESGTADDPEFSDAFWDFTVGGPAVSVDMDDVTSICCPGCSYPLQIDVTNNGDCPGEYDWELTGSGTALDPTQPFTPSSSGTVTVFAHSIASIEGVSVNISPQAPPDATAEIQITLTNTDPCTPDTASHASSVAYTGCDDTTLGPDWYSLELPFGCDPECMEPSESVLLTDKCGNAIKLTCMSHGGACFYEFWYNDTRVGKCVYPGGNNLFDVRYNEPQCRILATRHLTSEPGTDRGTPGMVDWQEYYYNDGTGPPAHDCREATEGTTPDFGLGQRSGCEDEWWQQ
jgi:hypothetical protein